ncbi:MAG: carbohydrate kinase family protein [Beutenbergiaceae bacterium]
MSDSPDDAPIDLLLAGTVFFDIVFTGFGQAPKPGTEVWTDGMGSSPGGIANLAVAASRLGLRTTLAAGFGDDLYADWLWQQLSEQEHVDLQYSQRFAGQHTPVTVAMAYADDRAFVTHGHPWPRSVCQMLDPPPASRAVLVDLGDPVMRAEQWWRRSVAEGALMFATAGWDPAGQWDQHIVDELAHCHAFVPNATEAMGYTHTSSPADALRELSRHVPLTVVTLGSEGVIAIDATTGEQAHVQALPVTVVDTTGAGDVFSAAIVLGTLNEWSLERRLEFASLCAALAVQQVGGSLAAPGWGDLLDWWRQVSAQAQAGRPEARDLTRRFGFLPECLQVADIGTVRRAEATIARFSDAR